MNEEKKCSGCGRSDVTLMTLRANQGDPTKPICIKCLNRLNQKLKQQFKRGGR
jgi:hypothetical protein